MEAHLELPPRRPRACAVLALAAAALLASPVLGVASASGFAAHCGGGWTAPGASCVMLQPFPQFPIQGRPLTVATVVGGPAEIVSVSVHVVGSVSGDLGGCSATGVAVASCLGFADLVPPTPQELRCVVEGTHAGSYQCGGCPPHVGLLEEFL